MVILEDKFFKVKHATKFNGSVLEIPATGVRSGILFTILFEFCACCKKIRDDKSYWNDIEAYLHKHAHTQFTHTMCPECIKTHYPDLWKKMEKEKGQSA